MNRKEILQTAEKYVMGDREQQYGTPEDNFQIIADLWNAYWKKQIKFSAEDVAIMMTLLKIGRIRSGQEKEDNWIDACGYLACGGEIQTGNVEKC